MKFFGKLLLFATCCLLSIKAYSGVEKFEEDVKKMNSEIKNLRTVQLNGNSEIKQIITSIKDRLTKFKKSEVNLHDMNGLGKIEQMKVRAERYGFERELRLKISQDINKIDEVIETIAKSETTIVNLKEKIDNKVSIIELLKNNEKSNENSELDLKPSEIRYYTVQKRDTIANISDLPEVYGDSERWLDIYSVNKDKISKKGADVMISKGVELIIPNDDIAKQFKKY